MIFFPLRVSITHFLGGSCDVKCARGGYPYCASLFALSKTTNRGSSLLSNSQYVTEESQPFMEFEAVCDESYSPGYFRSFQMLGNGNRG